MSTWHLDVALERTDRSPGAHARARRAALDRSARAAGILLPELAGSAPIGSSGGFSWASATEEGLLAAVVGEGKLALDVRHAHQRRSELVHALAVRAELDLLGGFRWQSFARLLAAKHALGRLLGVEPAEVRLMAAPAARPVLLLGRAGSMHLVHDTYADSSYVALALPRATAAEVRWHRPQ